MGKVLIFSDIHVACHKRMEFGTRRLDDCLKALDWVFGVARENKITNILFGGDFFHDRLKIDVYTYQMAYEGLKKNLDGNVTFWMLLGNHDLWYNDDTRVSSVFPLSTLPGVKIIDKPQRQKIENSYWDFVPFTHDPISWVQEFRTQQPGKPEYCLGHIALDGAILHGDTTSDVIIEHDGDMVRVNADLFSHYKRAFFGHYHAEQRVGNNCEYVGSPLELSFGEAFQKKHVVILDTTTGEKEYIENDVSPKHLILRGDQLEKYDLEGNFVQIIVDEIGTTDLIQMRRSVTEENHVASLKIKQRKKALSEHVIQDAKAILYKEEEMNARYADEVGTDGLEREELLTVAKAICQRATSTNNG